MSDICYGCMNEKGSGESVCKICGYENTVVHDGIHLKEGTVLCEKYLIGSVLGHGGFGITYLAKNTVDGDLLAIKEYFPAEYASRTTGESKLAKYSGDKGKRFDEGLHRFIKESKILEKYNDVIGIVSARDVFEENGTAYIVMEYLEGISLEDYLIKSGGKLDTDTAISIMMPIMDSLREVHKSGLVHRDISPDNIMITTNGQVKLLDFGAAKQLTGEKSKSVSVILKRGYAPEEQYRSRGKIGPWTDVYSVAATLYRIITGNVPVEPMERSFGTTLKSPTMLGVEMPEHKEKVIFKAMSIKHSDRYQTMEAFQNALSGRRSGLNIKEVFLRFRSRRKRSIFKVSHKVASVSLLCVLIIGAAYVYSDIQSRQRSIILDAVASEKSTESMKTEVIVPDVIGFKNSEALFVLRDTGVLVKEIYEYNEVFEKNCVISQSISTDTIFENQLVVLTVSKGSEEVVRFDDLNLERKVRELLDYSAEEAIHRGDLVDIESFEAKESEIASLEGMEFFEGLKELDLEGNSIADISELYGLRELEMVNLSDNKIQKFDTNDVFPKVEDLNLSLNELTFFTCSDSFDSLDVLDISENDIKSILFDNSVNKLQELNFSKNETDTIMINNSLQSLIMLHGNDNQLKSIDQFAELSSLRYVDLSDNRIEALPSFSNMVDLEELSVADNKVESVDFSGENLGLIKIDLSGNNINTISSFDGIPNLRSLDISNNKITSLKPMTTLTKMTSLKAAWNDINSSYGISHLKSLKSLDLQQNEIKSAAYVNNLDKLAMIDLSGNELSSTNGINNMPKLNELNLSNNRITSMQTMANLDNLKILDLSKNSLPYLQRVGNLTSLEELNVSENRIRTVYESIHYLDNLKTLNISINNPTGTIYESYDYYFGFPTTSISSTKRSFNISFLNELDSIETVNLSYTNTTSLYALTQVETLKTVNLYGNDCYTTRNQNYVNEMVDAGIEVQSFYSVPQSKDLVKGGTKYRYGGK